MSPWKRVHLPGGGGGNADQDRLTVDTAESHPAIVAVESPGIWVPESHPTPQDSISLVGAVGDESHPAPVETTPITMAAGIEEQNPVPEEDVTLVGSVSNEQHPVPTNHESFGIRVVEESPVPAEDVDLTAFITADESVPVPAESASARSSTGDKFGASHTIQDLGPENWLNPGLIYEADEPDQTAWGEYRVSVLEPTGDNLFIKGFKLLSEDGGTIPPGATIIGMLARYRWFMQNGANNALHTSRGAIVMVPQSPQGTELCSPRQIGGGTPANSGSGWNTETFNWGGTVDNPQSSKPAGGVTITRSMLAVGQLSLRAQVLWLNGSTASSWGRLAWVDVSVTWALL